MTAWKGFKELEVVDTVKEDEVTTSFYLKERNGEPLPDYLPGQFITVKFQQENGETCKPRAYSLSTSYRGNFYRISVKREADGDVSKILCDQVKPGDMLLCTRPVGHFYLHENERPAVFIGGGIGITPMIAMAEALDDNRQGYLLYSTRNNDFHSFQEEIEQLAKERENITATVFYTRPQEGEKEGEDYDVKGRISEQWMKDHLPLEADFYFCGPVPFMKQMYHNLVELGVDKERIFYESFEAGVDITVLD